MKITKSHLRKIIKEELQEVTYDEDAKALLIDGLVLYFAVGPDEAQGLLAELEDVVYWQNKNKPQTDDDEPYDIDKETRHVDAMGKPFSGPGSAPEDFGPLHPKYKK